MLSKLRSLAGKMQGGRQASSSSEAPFISPYQSEIEERSFKVIYTVPIYKCYPIVIHSLQEQTYNNWELILIHDGPADPKLRSLLEFIDDPRIHFSESDKHFNDWGHSLRAMALEKVESDLPGDFVVMTNADNYHVPGFTEKMLETFDTDTQVAYCDMVHDYYDWNFVSTSLTHSFIDCACLMIRCKAALEVGWRSQAYDADWEFIADIRQKYGDQAFRKIASPLVVHN